MKLATMFSGIGAPEQGARRVYGEAGNSMSVNVLEMLSLWILFVNFSETKKPLIEEFEEYRDAEQYLRIIELISETEIAKLEGTLFEEAYKIVAILKG